MPSTIEELTRRRDAAKEELEQADAALQAAIEVGKAQKDEAKRTQREALQQEPAAAQAKREAQDKKIAELQAKLGKPPVT
ncbi:hypothetical protein WME98_31950 [Sorangium sp. So ce296]|uniref:hypothetical protein n=1 Tax=Sorangium sp. So ce296 TaxID=3133296 RepID=UPI003F5D7F2D